MKQCKKCGNKLVHHNKIGYCQECLKLGVVALGIYKCIEPNCKKKVCGPDRRCNSCAGKGNKNNYKHGNYCRGKIHYCIEPNCNEEVLGLNRRCLKCRSKGKNNSCWKGGITDLRTIIRGLDEYEQWRTKIFQRDNYICKTCNKTKCYLEAHHKKEFAIIFNEFLHQYSQFSPIEDKETLTRLAMTYAPFWDVSNGITLCRKCHDKTKKGSIKNV